MAAENVNFRYVSMGEIYEQIMTHTKAQWYPFAVIADDSRPDSVRVLDFIPDLTSAVIESLIYRFKRRHT
jgi:hypothetical protein